MSRRIRFYQRQIVETYLAFGRRVPQHDEAVIRLLDGFARYLAVDGFQNYPPIPGTPTLEQLREERAALMADGCRGPIVNYVFTILDPNRNYLWRPAERRFHRELREHADRLGRPGLFHPMLLSLDYYILRNMEFYHGGQHKWLASARISKVNAFSVLFRENIELTEQDQIEFARLFNYLSDDVHQDQAGLMMEKSAAPPADREWLALIFRGLIYTETAWEERGGGWASTVTDEGWQKFGEYLKLAEVELNAAWRLRPDRSEAATRMITVAMGQSSGEEWQWFDRAMTADPLDTEAFEAMRWAYRDRWGGDGASAFTIASQALIDQRFDTDLPEQFDQAVSDMIDDYGYGWLRPSRFGGMGADAWALMQVYLEGRANHPNAHRHADWCWSRGFGLGYRSGRLADARVYFERLKANPQRMHDLHLYGLDRRWTPGEFASLGEPAIAAAIDFSERYRLKGDLTQAVQTLTVASPQARHPLVQMHLRDRLRILDWSREFEAGHWVELLEHGLEGWRPTRGRFTRAERGVSGTYGKSGLRMIAGLEPGQRYEAELKFRVADGFFVNLWGGVGFVLDPVVGNKSSKSILCFLTRAPQTGVWIQDPDHDAEDDYRLGQDPKAATVTLRLVRWDNQIQLWLNGQYTGEPHTLQTEEPRPLSLGIGAWHDGRDMVYGFDSLKIRKLNRSPF